MVKVLLIDNEESQLVLLHQIIKSSNIECEIFECKSLEEATKLIECDNFDVIITDMEIEEEDSGLKVIKIAKNKNIFSQVIVVTNYERPSLEIQSIELGAYDYIKRTDESFVDKLINKFIEAINYRKSKLT